jgi:hypothetical protein
VSTADAVGWAGALALLVSYSANSIGRLRASGRVYQAMNIFGSAGLGIIAARHRVWPSFAVNALWLLIAVAAFTRSRARRSHGGEVARSNATPSI